MADVMEKALTEESAEKKLPLKAKWKGIPKKTRRRIRNGVILLAAAGLCFAGWKKFGGEKTEMEVVTDMVTYGSITSKVEGYGLTKSKTSESITLSTGGIVQEVYVMEGQRVEAGEPLFVVESEAARTAVEKARSDLESLEKQFFYNRFYLEKQFMKLYGMPVISYRNALRTKRAKELLKEHSVTETAALLGYSSVYAFSRAFKNSCGEIFRRSPFTSKRLKLTQLQQLRLFPQNTSQHLHGTELSYRW